MMYFVEVGGFVSTLHHRKLTVFADSAEEAIEKAKDRFVDVQQSGNRCYGR